MSQNHVVNVKTTNNNNTNARDSKGNYEEPPVVPLGDDRIKIESFNVGDILIQLYKNANYQSIDNLINTGANLNAQNADGLALIHLAVMTQNLVYLQYLLLKGANPNLQTLTETSPLHIAISSANLAIARILILCGANANLVDEDGESAAHYAIRESNVEALGLLLSSGANPNLANDDGESLLHFAASVGEEKCCRLLVQAGANTLTADASGCTPLVEAKNNGHVSIVEFLRSQQQPQQQQHQDCPYNNFSEINYGINRFTPSPIAVSSSNKHF